MEFKMYPKNQIILCVILALPISNAQAFGLGDVVGNLIGAGMDAAGNVVGAVGGAAMDKVKDAFTDPAAEAKKKEDQKKAVANAMQAKIDQINAVPNLRPIDRQRLILSLQKFQNAAARLQGLQEQSEAAQKAQRAQVFTASGMMGIAGNALTSMPGLQVAQASAMASNPLYRQALKAQNTVATSEAQLAVAAKIPQTESKVTLAETDAITKSGINQIGAKADMKLADASANLQVTPEKVGAASVMADAAGAKPSDGALGAQASQADILAPKKVTDAFNQDLGRKIYVNFVDSPKQTAYITNVLKSRGYDVVDKKEQADVIYLVEGEYYVTKTSLYNGITQEIGVYLDSPNTVIAPPERKLSGTISAGLAGLALGMQGVKLPSNAGVYDQEVLLVVARQPKGDSETRYYVVKAEKNARLDGVVLAQKAKDEIYRMLGISEQETQPDNGAPENSSPLNAQSPVQGGEKS